MKFSIFEDDLAYIQQNTTSILPKLQDSHIFITGANGFFGIWIIEFLLYLNIKLNFNITVYALTRNLHCFYKKFPHLTNSESLKIIEGNVLSYNNVFPKLDYIIHAANLPQTNNNDWATNHILYGSNGTCNVLDTAKKYNVKSILITSSGAVYNNFNLNDISPFCENDININTNEPSVYAQTKIIIEQLAQSFYNTENIPTTIARCFALSGAYLSLKSFAFGNFIQNAINKEKIIIKSSGLNKRSYMYASDLVVWIITMLIESNGFKTYNVGSNVGISIKDVAALISNKFNLELEILNLEMRGNAPLDYVPNTQKALDELNLYCGIDIDGAINKTFQWNKIQQN